MLLAGALLLRFGGVFERLWVTSLAAPPEPWEGELFQRMAGAGAGGAEGASLRARQQGSVLEKAQAPALV